MCFFYGQKWKFRLRRGQVVWKMDDEAMVDPSPCSYVKNIKYPPFVCTDHNLVANMDQSCSNIGQSYNTLGLRKN